MPDISADADTRLSAQLVDALPLTGTGLFVRAGSALLLWRERLLAVQDDALAAVWIDPQTRALTPLIFYGTGAAMRKREKPDFEAALIGENGDLYVLGSGASPKRRGILRMSLQNPAPPALVDAGILYDAIQSAIGECPNIEGAVLQAGSLRLFHRAVQGGSTIITVEAAALAGQTTNLLAVHRCELGAIGGVPLGFTDATTLADGRILYLAAAENAANAIADGPVAGAAIGVLEPHGARYARLLEADGTPSLRKVEGVVVNADQRSGWLLTDPDDPDRPAELCRFRLDGPW